MADRSRNLAVYRELVARFFGDIVKGKANPYTSMNGNMYSFLDGDSRICLRMSEPDRLAFAKAYGTEPVKQYGAIMRGYVAIPESDLADASGLAEAFEACHRYATSLPKK